MKEKRQLHIFVDKQGAAQIMSGTRKEFLFVKLHYSLNGLTPEELEEYKQLNK